MPNIGLSATRTSILLLFVVSLGCHTDQSNAEGALAIGLPNNVAKDGVAYGYTTKKGTSEAAKADALHACQTNKDGSEPGHKLCRIVETFTGKCVAIAIDPKAGTPGVGWSVGADRGTTEAQAMSHCKATAGTGREKFCKLDKIACDE